MFKISRQIEMPNIPEYSSKNYVAAFEKSKKWVS
jgi:hypothetical protein